MLTGPDCSIPIVPDVQLAERDARLARRLIAADDWTVLISLRPTTLLEGTRARTAMVLRALAPFIRAPIERWTGRRVALNPATMIVADVHLLDAHAQQVFHAWLGAHAGSIRVIATSEIPLFPLVERGEFLSELYYRLNVFQLELHPCTARPS